MTSQANPEIFGRSPAILHADVVVDAEVVILEADEAVVVDGVVEIFGVVDGAAGVVESCLFLYPLVQGAVTVTWALMAVPV